MKQKVDELAMRNIPDIAIGDEDIAVAVTEEPSATSGVLQPAESVPSKPSETTPIATAPPGDKAVQASEKQASIDGGKIRAEAAALQKHEKKKSMSMLKFCWEKSKT